MLKPGDFPDIGPTHILKVQKINSFTMNEQTKAVPYLFRLLQVLPLKW